MSRVRLKVGLVGATVFAALALSGCGGLTAASTCHDFMSASSSEQQEAIDKLASQYGKPDYTTPLGAPEVPYYCSANPNVTLGAFFQHAEG